VSTGEESCWSATAPQTVPIQRFVQEPVLYRVEEKPVAAGVPTMPFEPADPVSLGAVAAAAWL